MIPVLGVLGYNRGDLLIRMIESIDYQVGQLVHVANGVDDSIVAAHKRIRQLFPDNHTIFVPGDGQPREVNLGYAGGNNWILKNFINDWVLLVGSDVYFEPGDLQIITEHYEAHKNDNPPPGLINCQLGWNCQGISRHGVEVMGYLDENFYPLYMEDVDYNWRHTVAQRHKWVSYDRECTIRAHHDTSSTTHNMPPEKRERMAQAFNRNRDYLIRKWGGPQGEEKWDHPFNDPSKSIKDWTLEPGRWELNKLQ